MNKAEMIEKCKDFFGQLALTLFITDGYIILSSCNKSDCDITDYLVPEGTTGEVTYTSKPVKSFRVSDHWNWYANTEKCPLERYIQCYTTDMPWTKKRLKEGFASKPIYGTAVMFFGDDGKYHHVYGEKFDRRTKTWNWVEGSLEDAVRLVHDGKNI